MKRIIVTGAAGFLGSHIVEHHLNAGDDVYGVDNFCSSNRSSVHHQKLLHTDGYVHFSFDIAKSDCVPKLSRLRDIDLIYNFACPASPPTYQRMPIETMMTCVAGTKNMLEIANMNKAVLVQASTSEVYGDPETSPQFETDKGSVNSYGPRSCYDEGKRAAEALCYDYLHKFNVDARLVRIFNTYGPHMLHDDGRVITNFINQALHGKMITIYGAGKQTRSFCYVDDLIAAIIAMGELKKNPMTPINIGNPNEFTIRELADKVTNMIESSQGFEFKPLPVDDPMQRKPDIANAISILNWRPKVEIDEGLARTIQYFKSE